MTNDDELTAEDVAEMLLVDDDGAHRAPVEGIYKVVSADQLHDHTSCDWQLVRLVPDFQMRGGYELQRRGDGASTDHYAQYRQHCALLPQEYFKMPELRDVPDGMELGRIQVMPVETNGYLLRRCERKVAELERARAAKAEQNLLFNEATLRKSVTDLETRSKEVVDLEQKLESKKRELYDSQRHMRKLEEDLAKVRKAVGEIKWQEIVG